MVAVSRISSINGLVALRATDRGQVDQGYMCYYLILLFLSSQLALFI